MTAPMTIVTNAITNGEFDKLLLGIPPYRYLPRSSPAPGTTDLTELLAVIYEQFEPMMRNRAKEVMVEALDRLVEAYEGLEPVARCILFEVFEKNQDRFTLGLPLQSIAEKLQSSIQAFEPRLRGDKSGAGWQWPDGLLGELRKLSRNTEGYGGPSFCK